MSDLLSALDNPWRRVVQGLCDVKWDSGNKPEIDNTYFIYNCGNDGLYHLALAEEVCLEAAGHLLTSMPTSASCAQSEMAADEEIFEEQRVRMSDSTCVSAPVCFACARMFPMYSLNGSCPRWRNGKFRKRRDR